MGSTNLLKTYLRAFLLALSFLTTLPVPSPGLVSDDEMSSSLVFFPLTGLIIGFISFLFYYIGILLWNPQIAAWLWLISNALITGGLHLDGWIDTFDALGSHKSRSEMLTIMKDSRIGAMGGISAILLFGLKWSLLSNLSYNSVALLVVPLMGRVAIVLSTQTFTYIKEKGLGHSFTKPLQLSSWLFVLFSVLVPIALFTGSIGLVSAGISLLMSVLWATFLSHKFGGLTGDNYGSLNEIAEMIFLLFVLVI